MDLILAVDLKGGQVVHGTSGERASYRPLTWGISPTASPAAYVQALSPRHLYIADLDRIMGTGDNLDQSVACSKLVETCYLDHGCRNPSDYLHLPGIIDVAATETAVNDLASYHGGYVSLDIRNGRIAPSGEDPIAFARVAAGWDFEGAIILNVSDVGTGKGIDRAFLSGIRSAYDKPLLYGGGVATSSDLDSLAGLGFEGGIVATAIHRGAIPLSALRRGRWC